MVLRRVIIFAGILSGLAFPSKALSFDLSFLPAGNKCIMTLSGIRVCASRDAIKCSLIAEATPRPSIACDGYGTATDQAGKKNSLGKQV